MSKLTLLASLFLMTPAVHADVLTVGPSGQFTDIQSAVDAAQDLDIVLVSSGDYGFFNVGDVSVTVIADVDQDVTVYGPCKVTGLSVGRAVSLIGFTIDNYEHLLANPHGWELFDKPALLLSNNAGPVRVEDMTIRAKTVFEDPTGPALRILHCEDVALSRTDLVGGYDSGIGFVAPLPFGHLSPPALKVLSSTLVVHGGTVTGTSVNAIKDSNGLTTAHDGAAGISINGGRVFLSGTRVTGGKGSRANAACAPDFFGRPAGDGGPGIEVVGATAVLRQLDTDVTGGPGGDGASGWNPEQCIPESGGDAGPAMDVQAGLDLPVAGSARSYSMQNPVREFEPFTLEFSGEPGDVTGVFWGVFPWSFYKPNFHGYALLDFSQPHHLIFGGTVPASGELSVPLAYQDLGPGWEGITLPFQAVFSGGPGQLYFSATVQSVVLDENQ